MTNAALHVQLPSRRYPAPLHDTRLASISIAAAVVLLTAFVAPPHARAASVRSVDSKALLAAGDDRSEWLTHGRTYDEQRF
ncbi:MAG: hypothetical protein ACTHL7_13530, partial [Steroidobacteraceae bacterium]